MLGQIFAGDKETDVLAAQKCGILFTFCGSALYPRLPSERRDAIIRRIWVDDVHLDLLSDRYKMALWKVQPGCSGNRPKVAGPDREGCC